MSRIAAWLFSLVTLLLFACSSDESKDSGGSGGASGALSQAQGSAIVAMETGTTAAAAVVAVFSRHGETVSQKADGPLPDFIPGPPDLDGGTTELDGGGPDLDGGSSPDEIKKTIGDGVSAEAPAGCVSFEWTALLAATVTFNGCQYGTLSIDGKLGLVVSIAPTTLSFTFTNLTVDGTKIDGNASLTYSGTEVQKTTTLAASVTFDVGGTTQLALNGVTLTRLTASTVLAGAGSLTTGGTTWTFSLADVARLDADCHPTSGSATLDDGTGPVTLTFLSKTPSTGIVLVKIGQFPAFEQALLAPCS